jgi:hypothetical protein
LQVLAVVGDTSGTVHRTTNESHHMHPLITYLSEHGVHAYALNGRLFAISEYVDCRTGALGQETVELRPTFGAIRAFLGY